MRLVRRRCVANDDGLVGGGSGGIEGSKVRSTDQRLRFAAQRAGNRHYTGDFAMMMMRDEVLNVGKTAT